MAKQVMTATVEAVNDRGVKLNNAWHNYSSYASADEIDRAVQAGDTVEVELTGSGWVRKLRVVRQAQQGTQQNGQVAPQAPSALGARQLDAAQYTRLRAVELASPVAQHYAEDLEDYLRVCAVVANWVVRFVEEGDPLG